MRVWIIVLLMLTSLLRPVIASAMAIQNDHGSRESHATSHAVKSSAKSADAGLPCHEPQIVAAHAPTSEVQHASTEGSCCSHDACDLCHATSSGAVHNSNTLLDGIEPTPAGCSQPSVQTDLARATEPPIL
jgi:hypothetical protein